MIDPAIIERAVEGITSSMTAFLADLGAQAKQAYIQSQRITPEELARLLVPDDVGEGMIAITAPAYDRLLPEVWNAALDNLIDAPDIDDLAIAEGIAAIQEGYQLRLLGIGDETRNIVQRLLVSAGAEELEVDALAARIEGVIANPRRSGVIGNTEAHWTSNRTEAEVWRNADIFLVRLADGPDCGLIGHHDPQLANDLVVDWQTYSAALLSHPNCVRSADPSDAARIAQNAPQRHDTALECPSPPS